MRFFQWGFVGAVLVLPLIYSDELVAVNPWGLALVRAKDFHGANPNDFYSQHFGTLISLAAAGFVFFLYVAFTKAGPMKSLMIAAAFFSTLHWLSFYVCGLFAVWVAYGMVQTGVGIPFAVSELVNDYIEVGRFQKSLEVPEFHDDGAIISYRYVKDLGDGGPLLSATVHGLSRGGVWYGGFLQSDRIPTKKNASGIYSCKNPLDPALDDYAGSDMRLVKIKNWGKVVEHHRGYRSQYAQIIEYLN